MKSLHTKYLPNLTLTHAGLACLVGVALGIAYLLCTELKEIRWILNW